MGQDIFEDSRRRFAWKNKFDERALELRWSAVLSLADICVVVVVVVIYPFLIS